MQIQYFFHVKMKRRQTPPDCKRLQTLNLISWRNNRMTIALCERNVTRMQLIKSDFLVNSVDCFNYQCREILISHLVNFLQGETDAIQSAQVTRPLYILLNKLKIAVQCVLRLCDNFFYFKFFAYWKDLERIRFLTLRVVCQCGASCPAVSYFFQKFKAVVWQAVTVNQCWLFRNFRRYVILYVNESLMSFTLVSFLSLFLIRSKSLEEIKNTSQLI